MRIICDYCNHPVSGTVTKVPGNLNLHPDCVARLGNETIQELSAAPWRSGESSVILIPERKGTERVSRNEELETVLCLSPS
jgi:DNA-binding sugar fermentation-stimulating protein